MIYGGLLYLLILSVRGGVGSSTSAAGIDGIRDSLKVEHSGVLSTLKFRLTE